MVEKIRLAHALGSEHYQDLRHMLVDIGARHPEPSQDLSDVLQGATAQISVIEVSVDRGLRDRSDPRGAANFNRELDTIQANLERIASSTHFARSEGAR